MGWLGRGRGRPPEDVDPEELEENAPDRLVRAAPGVAAFFNGLKEDGSHTILDLGSATEAHLRLYSSYARRIRFAGLLPVPPHGERLRGTLEAIPPERARPYDLVLAWNILDRLIPEERPILLDWLARLTGSGSRLYAVVRASGEVTTRPVRFTLVDLTRVSQEVVGAIEPAGRDLLPAQVERLLTPFEVSHAFTLRVGMREYVAVRR